MSTLLHVHTNIICHHTHTHTHTHTVPPTFMSQPQETLDAAEWMEVTLNCSASGSPTPLIRWEREGGAQLPVGAMIASSTNGNKVATKPLCSVITDLLKMIFFILQITSMLTFGMIRYEDRGRYWCVADNIQTNPVTSQYADIRVTRKSSTVQNIYQEIAYSYNDIDYSHIVINILCL